MSHELEDLLRQSAVEPSRPLDTSRVVARGRRRRRVRHATMAAGSMAMILLGTVVALNGPVDPQPPEVVDQPDESEPRPDEDVEEENLEEETPGPSTDEVARIDVREADRELLLADERGVHRVDVHGEQQTLWDSPVQLALPDGNGGAVVQEADDGAIRRVPSDAEPPGPAIAAPEEQPTLYTVTETGGRTVVLFTRRSGDGDAEAETLHAYRLDDGTEEDLGITGRLESGTSGVALVDGDLLLTRCHLECALVRVPWGADPEGDQAAELYDHTLPLHGLDGHDTMAAYVHMPQPPPGVEGQADDGPQLWLHDIAADERVEIPIPSPDDDTRRISVDLAPDATAALISFHPAESGPSRTLLIDDLTQRPRLAWLETTAHVRLDEAGS